MADDPIPFPDRKEPETQSEPEISAAQMLREFEDKHLGEDATRIDGAIEKGHGAHFHLLKPHHKAHHGALTRLVQAEKEMSDAAAAHSQARIKHAEAVAAVKRHADAAE